ncbi:MAG: polyprenyl synthetase family protein [Lachnospiraceae bacterium]|nr:polyprenyl synthetase family protein [Lachnospiraceae bacterium]
MVEKQIAEKAKQIEDIIRCFLPKEEGYQKTVLEAMNYSVLAGGKRLRPMLMQETYRMLGGMGHVVEPFMAAIEMIHTYSLVHDDLPAMDNDEYRRGRKTTHVVYGEDMAILAGDGLLNYAFETAMRAFDLCMVDDIKLGDRYALVARALRVLAKKAGIYGMIGGQTADVEAENKAEPLTGDSLLFIHQHKTAALIEASMMIGGILAGADEETINKLEQCAYDLGVAFQIQDDILDVIGDQKVLGKPIGSDARNGKQTYVTIYGMEEAQRKVKSLSEDGVYILDTIGGDNQFMKQLMLYLIHREK